MINADQAIEKCQTSVMVIGYSSPAFLLIHAKIRDLYSPNSSIQTMGITAAGRILFNIEFVDSLNKEELGGVMCHEMLHLVLMHHDRQGLRDQWLWNISTDCCINAALKTDGIKLPDTAVYPPTEYQGELQAEAIYEWFKKNPSKAPPQPKMMVIDGQSIPNAPAGAGCGVIPDPRQGMESGDGSNLTTVWQQTAIEARAMCQSIGRGSSAIAQLLAPRKPKVDWKKVLRHGFQLACVRPSRDYQSYAKKHRRSPVEGPQFPGWLGTDPSVAIVVDVSGSMDSKWVEQIVSEIKHLMKRFISIHAYLCVHTSEVVWSGFISPQTLSKIDTAVQFTGGTDAAPAYADVKKAGKFDCLIHFTDAQIGTWPPVPAKKLVIGLLGSGGTPPPTGSIVIPIVVD